MRNTLPTALVLALAAASARGQDAPGAAPAGTPADAEIVPERWLVLGAPDLQVRRPFGPSAVFARYLLDRDAPPPQEGEEVVGERRTPLRWTAATLKDGKLDAGEAWYAYATVTSPDERVVLAEARGVGALWVNGEPLVGDVYGYGFAGVPVLLRKGENRVFAVGLRGDVRVAFDPDLGSGLLATGDATVPAAGGAKIAVGVVARNVTREAVVVRVPGVETETREVRLLPLGVTKVPLPATAESAADGGATARVAEPSAGATGAGGTAAPGIALSLRAAPPGVRVVTRLSGIDGSVQEYAVVEPAPSLVAVPPRVVVALHGASVQAAGLAPCYSRRPGTWIVVPTNRRPFGFDWQDWGRRDVYEALDDLTRTTGVPSRQVYVTGHSMGGHGAWHFTANDPDRVLAVAPSAGWVSFDTYGGGPRPASALSPLWRGADGASDTLALIGNLAQVPAFVVHGTADDNVPFGQAETMLAALEAAGAHPGKHVQEGAGHWWDGELASGVDCVDLPAIFEHFDRARADAPPPDAFDWTSADPSIDARHHWVWALRPIRYGEPMRVRARREIGEEGVHSTVEIQTDNVARLNIALPGEGIRAWRVTVDGETLTCAAPPTAWLERGPAGWGPAASHDGWKTPERSGPLKRAFDRRFALVLPTRGTPAETQETTARVRFDAELWWYRGNGFADVVLDTEVLGNPERFAGRNLVLYGNADTNAAWRQVLGDGPVDVRRGVVQVGDRLYGSDGAACFFVRPRADDAEAVAAALADTGPRGCRLAMSHALFTSGVGYPDYVAWDERTATLGDGGVLAAGWFDASWSLDGRGFLSFGGETVR